MSVSIVEVEDGWLDEELDEEGVEEDVAEDEEKMEDEGAMLLLKEVEVFCVGAGRGTGGKEKESASCRG